MKKNRIHQANNEHIKSQREEILKYLEQGNTITHMQAEHMLLCRRLAARLHELKHLGHVIQSKWLTTRTKKKIKQYSLIQYQAGN